MRQYSGVLVVEEEREEIAAQVYDAMAAKEEVTEGTTEASASDAEMTEKQDGEKMEKVSEKETADKESESKMETETKSESETTKETKEATETAKADDKVETKVMDANEETKAVDAKMETKEADTKTETEEADSKKTNGTDDVKMDESGRLCWSLTVPRFLCCPSRKAITERERISLIIKDRNGAWHAWLVVVYVLVVVLSSNQGNRVSEELDVASFLLSEWFHMVY